MEDESFLTLAQNLKSIWTLDIKWKESRIHYFVHWGKSIFEHFFFFEKIKFRPQRKCMTVVFPKKCNSIITTGFYFFFLIALSQSGIFKVKNRWLIWEVSSAFLLIVKSSMKDRALSMGKKPFELWICCQMQAVNQNQWWIWIHFDHHPSRILIPPTAYKSSIIVGALGNWHVEKIPTVFSSSPRRKRTS